MASTVKEASWVTNLRQKALAKHAELPWPHASDDIWRRVDVSQLDPARGGFTAGKPELLQGFKLKPAQLAQYTQPLGSEQLLVRINGSWLSEIQPVGFSVKEGIDSARAIIEADGLTEPEQKLSSLNLAYHHEDITLAVPPDFAVAQPIRLVRLFSAAPKQALFPMTVITVGAGASVTLIDEYVSFDGTLQPHLINARIELALEEGATVNYIRLQRWGKTAREFLLQRATLGKGATLNMANINLGASLSKAHIVTKLIGEHATANLSGFVFGHDKQHIGQHTLQDHQAPHTTSDLHINAALQGESRMTYTGLIRIAKAAVQTQAYQANHNLMLSRTARAETIPMLEILADDVQCKHGASVGPIDDEQAFYLRSRGISKESAQRLIVMGFVETIIKKLPFEPLQELLRSEIEGSLHSE